MKKFIFVFLLLSFLISCGKVQKVNLDLKEAKYRKMDDQYASTRGMILINKIDDNLIWFSRKGWVLVIDDKSFAVLDKLKLEQGKGPEEYINLTEMFVINNELIYLYDHRLHRFIVLKYQNEKIKKYDTVKLNFSSTIGMEYSNGIFAVNRFVSDNQKIQIQLFFIDKNLNHLKTIDIAQFKMTKRKDLLNNVGWPVLYKDNIYYVSIGNGNTKVYDYKTKKVTNKFYNDNKKMKMIYDHKDANVITPTLIKNRYLFIPYNPHTDKNLKTPGMYYELFDLNGNLVDDGFIKFGLDKIPPDLMDRYTINISSNFLYFYDKDTNIFKKFEYIINTQ
ncbi:MAG: hypothetical protein FXF47_05040 [Candidatus Mcinerneyibacterium aminivorans]|uniref:6-bladed beta-propeller n=1 Tax=Candidatus Mcinerneyibacterium aminivorans TaxID=2703815 RepID=A0A5D0MI35_9BACT|nr:MAG: hypothetical protein FXF47_05040 [Candidatus Mcinerneyibacterium aminivorans]